ncbi:hypothetical protein CA13_16800 [Planctomycetes bacterium CA13]|uniref:Uncharacterized protein n=1 Tax=Novipirellula herctigrandis TaxID=2527986 RepID=A0A5C5Z0A4_9BACT|nr:hypothetical protein CA13_16800 [Planctomycetes bacterium CA13]
MDLPPRIFIESRLEFPQIPFLDVFTTKFIFRLFYTIRLDGSYYFIYTTTSFLCRKYSDFTQGRPDAPDPN